MMFKVGILLQKKESEHLHYNQEMVRAVSGGRIIIITDSDIQLR